MLALFSVAAFAQNNTKETAPAAKEIKGTVFEKGTLKELLAKAAKEKKYLFVDVYATWCGPCRMVAPVIDEIATEKAGQVAVYKVDIDQSPDLAFKYQVSSVPTLIVFENGQIKNERLGAQPKQNILAML